LPDPDDPATLDPAAPVARWRARSSMSIGSLAAQPATSASANAAANVKRAELYRGMGGPREASAENQQNYVC
jgi:hypothetical protein